MIWVNIIHNDLYWVCKHIWHSSDVYLLHSLDWNEHKADVVIFCDACLEGMGFWYLFITIPTAYYSSTPQRILPQFIFYYEALCVLSTLHHTSHILPFSSCILIYTDNTNTVNIFYTLCALPAYNFILRSSVNTLLNTNHQLWVQYVSSDQNGVANSISQHQFGCALTLCPNLHISSFEPPHLPLGAIKKWSCPSSSPSNLFARLGLMINWIVNAL